MFFPLQFDRGWWLYCCLNPTRAQNFWKEISECQSQNFVTVAWKQPWDMKKNGVIIFQYIFFGKVVSGSEWDPCSGMSQLNECI